MLYAFRRNKDNDTVFILPTNITPKSLKIL